MCQQIIFAAIFFASGKRRFLDGERKIHRARKKLKIALDARARDLEFF
jgi:hypothetical protein